LDGEVFAVKGRAKAFDMDIREFAVEAIEELIAWHTVGIVGDSGNGPGTGIGTGTAISWCEHTGFLTAKHVVEKIRRADLCFFFRAPGDLVRAHLGDPNPLSAGMFAKARVEVSSILFSETHDLAILMVPRHIDEQHSVRFFELDTTATTPPPGTTIAFSGFPAALAERVPAGGLAAFRSVAYQQILDQPTFNDFDPRDNFAASYTFGQPPVDPGGFSGAAAWFDAGTEEQFWRASLGFSGVLTAYHRKKGIVEGVRAEAVRSFLASVI